MSDRFAIFLGVLFALIVLGIGYGIYDEITRKNDYTYNYTCPDGTKLMRLRGGDFVCSIMPIKKENND